MFERSIQNLFFIILLENFLISNQKPEKKPQRIQNILIKVGCFEELLLKLFACPFLFQMLKSAVKSKPSDGK